MGGRYLARWVVNKYLAHQAPPPHPELKQAKTGKSLFETGKFFPKPEKTHDREPKPEKVFSKSEKVFSKPENCYFNKKTTFFKPENGACNWKIT